MTTLVTPESLTTVLGVVYLHRKTSDGGDIYLTRFGLAVSELLELGNWYEKQWFRKHRERLEGTSAVYRVPTKDVNGRSLDLVVKNCRVGEDVPLETRTLLEFINAEFNSPWEEFALVLEMREGRYGPSDIRIRTQDPLAIYVPPERMQVWQSGRSQEKINRIRARHPGIDVDILRQYKLIYAWIRGEDVVTLLRSLELEEADLVRHLEQITDRSIADMDAKGFAVADMKPAHVIIEEHDTHRIEALRGPGESRPKEKQIALVKKLVNEGRYSVVDYELLMRTPAHEEEVSESRRHSYLDDQRDRHVATPLPAHLESVEILDVPYIFGHAESTGGNLWVVGRNARLFDYFLPERWRKTHGWRLSDTNEVFYTFTKDHVHLVWKTSRVGEDPAETCSGASSLLRREHGFNSPFEEFAIAQDLRANAIGTVYMRAIYMTGSQKLEPSTDRRRYESHRGILDPEGERVLRDDRNYITLRGYYNGPDEWVARQEGRLLRPVNLEKAVQTGILDRREQQTLFQATVEQLKNVGYDGTLLEGNDLLIALDRNESIVKDREGRPEIRICNFELLRKQ